MSSDRRLVLASASPARLSLLRQAGLAPEVVVSQVDESTVRAPRVAELVALLAAAKAAAVAKRENDALVIGADSLLEFHGKPLGKPADAAEARDRWRRMAGAFTLDGLGAPFVRRVEGDPAAVVGLSLTVLRTQLAKRGLSITDLWRR
jgi:septum formation protein